MFHTKLLNSDQRFLVDYLITTTTPFLEFSMECQSNSLIYDKGYSIRQQMIYCLIQFMKEEGMGYRKISKKLNQWGIKTHRGCEWFNTSVSSVLKRKHERDDLVNYIRNKHYPSKVGLEKTGENVAFEFLKLHFWKFSFYTWSVGLIILALNYYGRN